MTDAAVECPEATWRRPASERVFLAFGSFAVALAFFGFGRSGRFPNASVLALIGLCVLVWEVATLASTAALRRCWGSLDSSWRLASAVLIASLPATGAMAVVFKAFGEGITPSTVYVPSLALGLLLAFARRGLRSRGARTRLAKSSEASAAPPADPARAFLRRHVPGLAGHRLVALQAEDHYLRVHTSGGTALVLMRLRDAVAALGPEVGWQPHRSFWVASAVETRVERDGPNWSLSLEGGLRVPVSRANVPRLRDLAGAQRRSPASTSR